MCQPEEGAHRGLEIPKMSISALPIAISSLLALVPPNAGSPRMARSTVRVTRFAAARVPPALVDRRSASLATAILVGCALLPSTAGADTAERAAPRLAMETTAGTMEFELWPDVAPKTVENFVKLARSGFFDGQCFHRVISGFVIQGETPALALVRLVIGFALALIAWRRQPRECCAFTRAAACRLPRPDRALTPHLSRVRVRARDSATGGDPNSKEGYGPTGTLDGADVAAVRRWGRGGPGYTVPAEFNPRKHEFGVLSMARSADPNSAGSQFFVCLGNLPSLDNQYTTFGRLTAGDNVLRTLGRAETARGDYPKTRQGITSVRVLP
jgi:cyclophilin family peptidyl-prolyl cis-trans isomerase